MLRRATSTAKRPINKDSKHASTTTLLRGMASSSSSSSPSFLHRRRRPLSESWNALPPPSLYQSRLSGKYDSSISSSSETFRIIRRQQSSSPPSSPSSSTLEEEVSSLEAVMESIERQSMEDENRRALENPTPWFSLLHHPSRAAWRSSDHLLGADAAHHEDGNEEISGSGAAAATSASALSESGFNLLQHSERTNKQLKRTYKRVIEAHKSLAHKRERERRLAANMFNQQRQKQQKAALAAEAEARSPKGKPEGSIQDGEGRRVGEWRDKNSPVVSPSTPLPVVPEESPVDDPSVALAFAMGISTKEYKKLRSSQKAAKLAKTKTKSTENNEKPVAYGPEQTLTNVRYRLGPNYSIVRRVLEEVQSLLGGTPPPPSAGRNGASSFRPRRVLDFGSGVGSSSAAALDVFGVSRGGDTLTSSGNNNNDAPGRNGIDWIHSIDASQSMREAMEKILKSMLEGAPWDDSEERERIEEEEEDEESAELERLTRRFRGGNDSNNNNSKNAARDAKRMERQRKRMQKWERKWIKRTDHRTRLTFGESIVDSNALHADKFKDYNEIDDRPPLPWQDKLDEQRRQQSIRKKSSRASASSSTSQKGSFDLILCNYTLSEFPNVPSTLAASALLWEKLAPGGVIVFVEPGTPDGFGLLRSVRTALLECCPPREVREKRRREREARKAALDASSMEDGQDEEEEEENVIFDEDGNVVLLVNEDEGEDDDFWPEECHVIAPCTHNGTCPMSRHRTDHVKRESRANEYEAAAEPQNAEDEATSGEDNNEEEEDEEKGSGGYLSEWQSMDEDDREELKRMLGAEGASDEAMEEMMKLADEENEDDDDDSDEGNDQDEEEETDYDDDDAKYEADHTDFYNIDKPKNEPTAPGDPSNMAKTDVFNHSFCSFVHNFPGSAKSKRGEKFSYLVLQKRTVSDPMRDGDHANDESGSTAETAHSEDGDLLSRVDVVELMSRSVYHAQRVKEEDQLRRKAQKLLNIENHGRKVKNRGGEEPDHDSHHMDRFVENLRQAVEVEDKFLDSTTDSLGLELLTGDDRRKGWGRLIRAPLKKKGHVLMDYCSAGCGGKSDCGGSTNDVEEDGIVSDGTRGRITRQKVSRGWSTRSAPGCYGAARKARWGGLWPDLSERVKQAEHDDFARKKTVVAKE